MMDIFGIVGVAAIAVICYFVGMGAKAFDKFPDKDIPVLVMAVGGVLGVVGYLTKMPDFPANDILTAIAVGIVSGAMSTAVNQVIKQNQKEA